MTAQVQDRRGSWRDRGFLLFASARTVSVAGYAVTTVALPLLVLDLTGSPFLTSAVAALRVVPYLVFGLLAGAVADRVDRRRLMVGCDVLAAAALATVPIASAAGVLTTAHVLTVAAVTATCFVWFDAGAFGALPALVGKDRLPAANSALFTSTTIVEVAVPAAAGLLVAAVGPAGALSADALSYLVSAALLARLPRSLSGPRRDAAGAGVVSGRGIGADVAEGLAFLRTHPLVRALTLVGFGNSVAGGAVTGLTAVYSVRALGLDVDDPRVAFLPTAGAVGAVLAALALPRLLRRLPPGRITLAALTVSTPLLVGLALAPGLAWALLFHAAWAALWMLVVVNGITARQQFTPDHLQGRVNTTARMIAWGGTPFGALLAGALAEATSVRGAYLGAAGVATLTAAVAWTGPLRRGGAG